MRQPTWKELTKVVEKGLCGDLLLRTPDRYLKAMALALAIARWSPKRPSSVRGEGQNGLCIYDSMQYIGRSLSADFLNCLHCPLKHEGQWCGGPNSIYTRWSELKRKPGTMCFWAQRDAVADEMYNLLCRLYKQEYDKC